MRKHLSPAWQQVSFFWEKALGRLPIFTRRSCRSISQIISARLSKKGHMVTFASDTSLPRHTSTSWNGWLKRRDGSVFWFLCTILGIVTATATISLRTLTFIFPRVTGIFSSSNVNDSLPTLCHCSWLNLPMSDVKVSESKFLIYTPLRHGFQLLIGWNR